jgi:hypothetical protein
VSRPPTHVRESVGPKAVAEGKRALESVRALHVEAGLGHTPAGELSALDCFALAVPKTLLVDLVEYARSVPGSKIFDPDDLVNYMKAEIGMRQGNYSLRMLSRRDSSKDLWSAYSAVCRCAASSRQTLSVQRERRTLSNEA